MVAIAGCQADYDAGTAEAILSESYTDSVKAEVLQALREGALIPVCGTVAPRATYLIVIAARSEHCFTCRDLGYRLRKIATQGVLEGAEVALVVPAVDVESTCAFARRERIRSAVLIGRVQMRRRPAEILLQ
jgi:hypothetical protein